MPDPTLRQIKEEMRFAILYHAVDAMNSFGEVNKIKEFITSTPMQIDKLYENHVKENPISLINLSEAEMEGLRGKTAMTEVIKGTSGGRLAFNQIRDLVYERYKDLGYEALAKKARNQVNEDYIYAGLRKYGILNDENDYSRRLHNYFNSRNKIELCRSSVNEGGGGESGLSWMIILVIFIIISSGVASLLFDVDTRTDQEKALSAYCAKMGRTCRVPDIIK